MQKCRLLACFGLALGIACAAPADAADPVLNAATDLPGVVMFMESHTPGMVLVAVRGSEQIIRGYGETAPGSRKEPTATH
jgi:serine-type D-Ala-D-Ala carboxypeptidase/endopeptidase